LFTDIFGNNKPVIGMVHLPPLPLSPLWKGSTLDDLTDFALKDAAALAAGGVDGLIIENQNDEPFLTGSVPVATVAFMTALAYQVRQAVNIPIGVNVLFNDWQAEIAIAEAVKASFIRVEVLVDTSWSDMGLLTACAPELLRLRSALHSHVNIFADVQGKYTAPCSPRPLVESAKDAQARGLADAIIVTGSGTGHATPVESIKEVKQGVNIPVLAGSGTSPENINDVFAVADGAIIGSYFKMDGKLQNPVDVNRVRTLMSRKNSGAK
jgi:membrane complex biogenesis BtpA family protein